MADSIKVASMVVAMSANVTEFERGMRRATDVANSNFREIEKSGRNFSSRLEVLMGNKGLFTGIKQIASSGDLIGKIGGIGVALGAWSLPIAAAVAAGRELIPVIGEISTRIKQSQIDKLTKGTVSLKDRGIAIDTKAKADMERTGKLLESIKPQTPEVNPRQLSIAKLVGDDAAKKIIAARQEAAVLERDANLARMWKAGNIKDARDQAMREAGFDPNVRPGRFAGVRVGGPTFGQQNDFNRAANEFGKKIEENIANGLARAQELRQANASAELMLVFSKFGEVIQRQGTNPIAGEAMRQWDMATMKVNDFAAQLEKGANQAQAWADKQMANKAELDALSPAKMFENEMQRINGLGLLEENANILRGVARQRLDAALPMVQPQFAGLVRANTAEASRAILASMLPNVKPEDRPLKELVQQSDEQIKLLQQIGDNTKKQLTALQPANF